MRYNCHYCGNPDVHAKDRFCANCGAPQPKRSPTAAFLLSILYAFFIWGTMFLIQSGTTFVYTIIVQNSLPYTVYADETMYNNAFWGTFSKYYALISICAALFLILLYVLFYTFRSKRFGREISLSKTSLSSGLASLTLGLSAQIIVVVAISLLTLLFPSLEEVNAANSENYSLLFGGGSRAMEILCIAVVTPILEEIVFRGLIYTRLRRAMPVLAAQILSALIFGAAHMNLMQFAYASLIGFLMAALFEKYQSIIPSIIFHMAFNGCSYLTAFIPSDILAYSLFFICIAAFLFGIYFVFRNKPNNTDSSVISHSERNSL